jgi:hypothetical protein
LITAFGPYHRVMRVLGVHCKSDTAYLAVVEDGTLIDDPHQRMTAPAAFESTERLVALMADVERLVTELGLDTVSLLQPPPPKPGTPKPSYSVVAPRVAIETVVRVGAARAGADVVLLSRARVRSRLGIPQSGSFESRISEVIPTPVGKYWNAGRNLAAVAALAESA